MPTISGRTISGLVAVAALLILAACGGESPEPAGEAAPAPVDAAEPESPGHRVHGRVVYFGRVALPAGSRLEVRLVDTGVPEAGQAVVADTVFDEPGPPPWDFEIGYDPAAIERDLGYAVSAVVYGPDERVRFSSGPLVPVDLAGDEPVEVRLRLVGEADAAPARRAASAGRSWQCEDLRLEARVNRAGMLELVLPGGDLVLPPRAAPGGVAFSDGGTELLVRDLESARLTLPGRGPVECVPTERRSPWAEAAERGVVFRASGNEPAWIVELSEGPSPRLTARLDMDTHILQFDSVEVIEPQVRYRATAPGNLAELSIEQAECVDSMSGIAFPVRAELSINRRKLTGCGRFLR